VSEPPYFGVLVGVVVVVVVVVVTAAVVVVVVVVLLDLQEVNIDAASIDATIRKDNPKNRIFFFTGFFSFFPIWWLFIAPCDSSTRCI